MRLWHVVMLRYDECTQQLVLSVFCGVGLRGRKRRETFYSYTSNEREWVIGLYVQANGLFFCFESLKI